MSGLRLLLVTGPELDQASARAWAADAGVGLEIRDRAAPPDPSVDGVVVAPGRGGFFDPDLAATVAGLAGAGMPTVAVEPGNLRRKGVDPASCPLARAGARVIYGRGPEVWLGALRHLRWRAAWPCFVHPYGDGPDRLGDLRLPAAGAAHPVAVLVHGGFWHHAWERDLMDGLAVDLVRRGIATWNLEYRRVGAGGGWPATGDDVAAGVDHLVVLAPVHHLDLARVTLVGHSAGGQLVLWAAGRVGAAVQPVLVAGLAALCDLRRARAEGTGGRAVERLVAAAADPEAALDEASPVHRLPLGVAQLLAHLDDDELVPAAQSREYAAAARAAGDEAELVETGTGGHFVLLDPSSPAWASVAVRIERVLSPA
jgi:acetyl esterase/lipase